MATAAARQQKRRRRRHAATLGWRQEVAGAPCGAVSMLIRRTCMRLGGGRRRHPDGSALRAALARGAGPRGRDRRGVAGGHGEGPAREVPPDERARRDAARRRTARNHFDPSERRARDGSGAPAGVETAWRARRVWAARGPRATRGRPWRPRSGSGGASGATRRKALAEGWRA